MVVLEDFFENVNLKKKSTDDKKACKITQHAKCLLCLSVYYTKKQWQPFNRKKISEIWPYKLLVNSNVYTIIRWTGRIKQCRPIAADKRGYPKIFFLFLSEGFSWPLLWPWPWVGMLELWVLHIASLRQTFDQKFHENLSKGSGDMEQKRKRWMTFNCDLDLESALLSYRFYTSSHLGKHLTQI